MTNRKSFIIHKDSLDILDDLTNEQAGELFKAIKAHHSNEDFTMSALVKIAFSPFKNQFSRDNEKYTQTCERRAIAGSKGGKQKVANASKCKQKVANLADSVSKSKNDSKSDSDSKNKRMVFAPPTIDDLSAYIIEKRLNVKADVFIDYYIANGWMAGKTKMKDWKATARNWSRRGQTNEKNNRPSKPEQFSNKLDEIAARDIAENGFTHTLDN